MNEQGKLPEGSLNSSPYGVENRTKKIPEVSSTKIPATPES